MAFTTEELINLGLSEEQVKGVFALHEDVNETKATVDALTQERESLKQQLEHTESQLENLKADVATSSEQKEALEKLQSEYDKYKEEVAQALAKTNKVNAITLALKDTNAHNPTTLMKFIDVDSIELDGEGKPKLDEVLSGLKESDPYLFQTEQEDSPNPNIVLQGNPPANGDKGGTDPFQAIMDSYGK